MLSNRHESTRVERLVTTNDDPSYRMSISETLRLPVVSRFKNMELHVFFCKSTSGMTDRHLLTGRIVSNRQHLPHCLVYNILTIDFWLFHALRTWKVHVVMFSYHATRFTHCSRTSLDFRYVNARFDIRCDDSSMTVDESQRFGCIGHVCLKPYLPEFSWPQNPENVQVHSLKRLSVA